MALPLVSILTPTYNHEAYISDCIRSVIAQSYTNWEMIIIDDGSTDNTLQIAKDFAVSDARISVYTQLNRGIYNLAETYNTAFSISQGKYIAVLEGDDVWLPEKLQLQITSLENSDAILAWGKAYGSSYDLMKIHHIFPMITYDKACFWNEPIGTVLKILLFTNHIPALTVVIRRDALVDIGGFVQIEDLPTIDLPTWQQLSLKGKFIYCDVPLGHWRSSSNQATKTYTIKLIEGVYCLSLRMYNENLTLVKSLGVNESQIHNYFKKRLVVNHHYAGKYHLGRGNVKEARKDFLLSISKYGFNKPLWKLKSIVWFVRSYIIK